MLSAPVMKFDRQSLSDEQLLDLYQGILLPRRIEEKMLLLLRQGRISKWFSGIGQEAISVGVTKALQKDEYILPLHRNLGVFTSRGLPLERLFMQWQGKPGGFSKGRERSFHFGTNAYHIVGMISHLGPQLNVANGIALAYKMKGEKKVCVVFTGEGGTSEGDFHEALNVASVWQLPVIFIIENNGYALSTPVQEQYHCKNLIDRGAGYGMQALQIDGNNLLDVYHHISHIADAIRHKPEPWLVECLTFRMRGHEEASGVKYVPKEYFEEWGRKDPVTNYEQFLLEEGVLTASLKNEIQADIDESIERALKIAFAAPAAEPDTHRELEDVYRPFPQVKIVPSGSAWSEKRFVDAISDALRLAMRRYPNLVLMGQDIAEYGGVFKVTESFVKEFGKERVRNTPLCESGILGAGLGLSIAGMKSVIEMQFADFVSSGFTQIVNNLAKSHYRWGQHADVVVRMPTGAGVGAGPFHSQSNEAWFFHTPGLKVVYPSSPYDAKGLLLASIEDPNPVMFFEHKFLYRSVADEIPEEYYTEEIGKAKLIAEGKDVSVITYGLGVHWARQALLELNVSADLLDLRTLLPLDYASIADSVKKTGKVIILHEDTLTGGIGAEIAAWISEHCFEYLDAPVVRSASLDTPVPFASALEWNFLPRERFKTQLKELLEY
ncbi:MAG: dehydrogenase [Chitinophagales bacterium]|nr:MAG: dehydrogenase [Chitinophagales bacterium]